MTETFFAYPSAPAEVGKTIRSALASLKTQQNFHNVTTWEENDIPGRFIIEPIFEKLEKSSLVAADITKLNFNVTFEIGFASGQKKRVILYRNSAYKQDDELIREVGIYDTLGHQPYTNSDSLALLLAKAWDMRPLAVDDSNVNTRSPVYVLGPRFKTDFELRIFARIKKARLQLRSFDPNEQGRLSASEAITNVAASLGVVVPLVPLGPHTALAVTTL